MQYNTMQYNTMQYSTMQYSAMQYNAIQYNTMQYYHAFKDETVDWRPVQGQIQTFDVWY